MVHRDLIASKLGELADRIARVQARVPSSADELAKDRDALDLVSFNLMLAVQICSDIASHIVADEGWAPSKTIAEGFGRLAEQGVISEQTEASLKRAVGLRNVVAHGYAGIDVGACHVAATLGLTDLERFAREVGAWVLSRPV